MSLLKGKVALVTGAGTGIGRETALALAGAGCHVILTGRRQAEIDRVAAEIVTRGGAASARAADVTSSVAITALMDWARTKAGPVDILVNNAGSAGKVRNVQWLAEDDWNAIVAVNLDAVYLLSKAVLPDMLARGGGTIVTIASVAGLRPSLLGGAAYGAAKAGVANFMTYLRNTFRNQGLRVTTIFPGEVSTPILDNRPRPPTADERARMAQPEDVARAVLLCCSLADRAVIEELVITPTRMRDVSADMATARWLGAPDGTPRPA